MKAFSQLEEEVSEKEPEVCGDGEEWSEWQGGQPGGLVRLSAFGGEAECEEDSCAEETEECGKEEDEDHGVSAEEAADHAQHLDVAAAHDIPVHRAAFHLHLDAVRQRFPGAELSVDGKALQGSENLRDAGGGVLPSVEDLPVYGDFLVFVKEVLPGALEGIGGV